MSNINNQTQDLFALDSVQDLDNESAAAVSGGVDDVILYSGSNRRGQRQPVNNAIRDLRRYNFNNKTSSVVVNSGTWRLYTGLNFTGNSIDVEADTARNLSGKFNDSISSLKSI